MTEANKMTNIHCELCEKYPPNCKCPNGPWIDIDTGVEWLLADHVRLTAECERLKAAERMSLDQAEDPGLWFNAHNAAEAYLQTALRSLHAVIEEDPCPVSG